MINFFKLKKMGDDERIHKDMKHTKIYMKHQGYLSQFPKITEYDGYIVSLLLEGGSKDVDYWCQVNNDMRYWYWFESKQYRVWWFVDRYKRLHNMRYDVYYSYKNNMEDDKRCKDWFDMFCCMIVDIIEFSSNYIIDTDLYIMVKDGVFIDFGGEYQPKFR
jgi:hypothetical protein